MTDSMITKTAFFSAPRETVWSYLTERDKLAQWIHPAEADLVEGEDYALMGKGEGGADVRQCWGTVLRMDRPSTLVYSFTVKPLGGKMTTVTWTLEDARGGTRLTLKHEGVGEAAGEAALGLLMALDKGWDQHLAGLRSKLA